MNVIFLDFDGVINTFNSNLYPLESSDAVENRVKILSEICHKYDCKIVIESSHKSSFDPVTLETDVEWMQELFELFKKYDIEVIGITPEVSDTIWKEDEILLYLERHPEVEHFCVIDDDDLVIIPFKEKGDFSQSDLNKVREHLVVPIIYSKEDPNKAGLQKEHIEEVGEILQKEIKRRI